MKRHRAHDGDTHNTSMCVSSSSSHDILDALVEEELLPALLYLSVPVHVFWIRQLLLRGAYRRTSGMALHHTQRHDVIVDIQQRLVKRVVDARRRIAGVVATLHDCLSSDDGALLPDTQQPLGSAAAASVFAARSTVGSNGTVAYEWISAAALLHHDDASGPCTRRTAWDVVFVLDSRPSESAEGVVSTCTQSACAEAFFVGFSYAAAQVERLPGCFSPPSPRLRPASLCEDVSAVPLTTAVTRPPESRRQSRPRPQGNPAVMMGSSTGAAGSKRSRGSGRDIIEID